jgi:hypothetical protein
MHGARAAAARHQTRGHLVWPYSIYKMSTKRRYTETYMGHTGEGSSMVRRWLSSGVTVFSVAGGSSSAGESLERFQPCKRCSRGCRTVLNRSKAARRSGGRCSLEIGLAAVRLGIACVVVTSKLRNPRQNVRTGEGML